MTEQTKKYIIIVLKIILYVIGLILAGVGTSATAQTLINHVV